MADAAIDILIVDDEPDNVLAISLILRDSRPSINLRTAADGNAAFELARSRPPDLVLTDWEMPVCDGLELIHRLRGCELTRDVPIIMCTGAMISSEHLETALSAGADDYVRKPCEPVELMARVNAMLRTGEHLRTITAQKEEIARQADELAQQNEVLRDNVRLREEVERISRHDLKTPLNSVISIPRLLCEEGPLGAEQTALLEIVERAGYRIMNMVNLSLDLFKMEKGTYGFHPSAVDLATVVDRVRLDLEQQAVTKRVALVVRRDGADEPAAPLWVWADELLSYSMLANLTNNAVAAAAEGTPVTVALSSDAGEASVSIHNAGAVPKSVRETFFDKYSTAGKVTGPGLGTYSARLMAETQRGRIAMATDEDEGTTITVTLPALRAVEVRDMGMTATARPDASDRRTSALDIADLRPLTVLVADDDADSRLVLSRYLPQPPTVVETAINGRQAVERFAACSPDLIIMDREMPVMDGLEATAAIREREKASGRLPATIVALSSADDEDTRQRFAAAGCDRYLRKPAQREQIVELLRELAAARTTAPMPSRQPPGRASTRPPGAHGATSHAGDAALANREDGVAPVLIDPDLMPLIPAFLERKRAEFERLGAAIAGDDRATVLRLAHRLRGSFSMYGFERLSELAAAIEQGARGAEAGLVVTLHDALREHLDALAYRARPDHEPCSMSTAAG